jgi:hypothetical protein
MKSIYTLVPDVEEILRRDGGWFTDDLANNLALGLQHTLGRKDGPSTLRLSQMGPRCPCALWHSIHKPELAEPLPPSTKFKFQYGHIIEELAITLFKAAGHHVVGEQDAVELDGVTGHRDCVVDGAILDVKSSSTPGFKKFADGSIVNPGADTFGYLDQIDGYLCASLSDPLVTVKDRAYLFVIDKTLGHMCLYEHKLRLEPDGTPSIVRRVAEYKEIVGRSSPPACTCETIRHGESGNISLGTRASYSPYKHCCFPNLRTFIYSKGPVYLTKVVRKPDVLEVDSLGNPVYHVK